MKEKDILKRFLVIDWSTQMLYFKPESFWKIFNFGTSILKNVQKVRKKHVQMLRKLRDVGIHKWFHNFLDRFSTLVSKNIQIFEKYWCELEISSFKWGRKSSWKNENFIKNIVKTDLNAYNFFQTIFFRNLFSDSVSTVQYLYFDIHIMEYFCILVRLGCYARQHTSTDENLKTQKSYFLIFCQ